MVVTAVIVTSKLTVKSWSDVYSAKKKTKHNTIFLRLLNVAKVWQESVAFNCVQEFSIACRLINDAYFNFNQ